MDTLGITLFRVVVSMMMLLVVMLAIGHRSMGEMSPFDFIISITIGAVAGALIIDQRIEILTGLAALFVLGMMQIIVDWLVIKFRALNYQLNLKPVVMVEKGQILKKNLRKARMPVESLLQLLREKDVFDVTMVELAILEPHGKLSVLKKAEHAPITPDQVNINVPPNSILIPVILEGKLQEDTLQGMGFSSQQIEEFRKQHEDKIHEVFIAFMDQNKRVHIIANNVKEQGIFLH